MSHSTRPSSAFAHGEPLSSARHAFSQYRSELEAALRHISLVEDCAVLARRASGEDRIVAYLVARGPLSQALLETRLREATPAVRLPDHYAFVNRLPLTAAGLVDEAALARVPVVDEALAANVEKAVVAEYDVRHAMVFLDDRQRSPALLHVSDLVPENTPRERAPSPAEPREIRRSSTEKPEALPALAEGAALSVHAGAPRTLPDALCKAAQDFDDPRITYLGNGQSVRRETFASLLSEARRIHGGLRRSGVRRGQIVLLQLDRPDDILPAFWGCLVAGAIPVVAAVPPNYSDETSELTRLREILRLFDAPPVVTANHVHEMAGLLGGTVLPLDDLRRAAPVPDEPELDPGAPAFLTLTSGSTGAPKAIMLSHRNVLSRAHGTNHLCSHAETDRILNWLPFDHIGSISDWHLRCVILGCHMVYCGKAYVLGDPLNWLRLVERFRITHSWAPNFAYALVNEAVKGKTEKWDLSSLRCLLTAGESVSSSTVREFLDRLAPYGLARTAIRPAFGMAELGSGVTYFQPTEDEPVRVLHVDRAYLDGVLRFVERADPSAVGFTSLGPVIPSAKMRIVDEQNRVLGEDSVGRLQIAGEPVCLGYYENPNANSEVFSDSGWFDTGDRGFIHGGELYLTGRDKETLVINGANYSSGELEAAVEGVRGVMVSFTAACAVRTPGSGERLAVFFCSEAPDTELVALLGEIQNFLVRRTGVKADYLLPVAPASIPKTAIGKIRRKELTRRFEHGEFAEVVRRVDLLTGSDRTVPDWFLRPAFRAKALPTPPPHEMRPRRVLLVEDAHGLADAMLPLFVRRRIDVTSVPPSADVPAGFYPFTDVVDLSDYGPWSERTQTPRVTAIRAIHRIMELSRALDDAATSSDGRTKLRYHVIASHSQATHAGDALDPVRATVPVLLASIAEETDAIVCAHVDVPFAVGAGDTTALAHAVVEECAAGLDAEVAYRGGQRLVRCFERVTWPGPEAREVRLTRGALYMITGGLGGVGVELARYLLTQWDARILLVGRRELEGQSADAARRTALIELERHGAVLYAAVDATDEAALADAVARAEDRAGAPVAGVFHLASAYHEAPLAKESPESLEEVLAPKVLAAKVIEAVLGRRDAFVVCFSSLAAINGGANIGAYAAANRLLDALCHEWRRLGRASYNLNWSIWKGLGIGANAPVHALRARGYQVMHPAAGLSSLAAALTLPPGQLMIGIDPEHPVVASKVDAPTEPSFTLTTAVAPENGVLRDQLPRAGVTDAFGTPVPLTVRILCDVPLTPTGELDRTRALAALQREAGTVGRPPSTPLEQQLASMWETVLGVDGVGVDQSFFDLGGTSLLSVRLFAEIERVFGVGLPLATLFRAPTIEALSVLLEAEHSVVEVRSIRLLSRSQGRHALHLIHDVDGTTTAYEALADHLAGSVRVFGLMAHGDGAFPLLDTRIEDMVAHFVAKIRRTQPHGPYNVGGAGIGGVLAHAIACRLHAEGESVPFVALLDSIEPTQRPMKASGKSGIFEKVDRSLAERLRESTTTLTRTGVEYARVKLLRRFTDRRERPPWFLEHIPLEAVYRAAVANYTPPCFDGKLTLFRANGGETLTPTDVPAREQCADALFGWESRACRGVTVFDVAGGHVSMFQEPHVPALARLLEHAMSAANADGIARAKGGS